MPNRSKADLIIHPVRLGIIQALAAGPQSTQEIAQALPEVSIPSLYRHLKMLLEGQMVEVEETRKVRALQEKVYRLAQAPYMTAEDMAGMSAEELLKYFTSYTASLIQGFADYTGASGPAPNMESDQTGFTETYFYASSEEMEQFRKKLIEILRPLVVLKPDENRRRRKLAIISHPVDKKEESYGTTPTNLD